MSRCGSGAREYCSGESCDTPCIADRRYPLEFSFPISRCGSHNSGSVRTLGHGLPPRHHFGSPTHGSETQQLLGRHGATPSQRDEEADDPMAKNPNPRTLVNSVSLSFIGSPFRRLGFGLGIHFSVKAALS